MREPKRIQERPGTISEFDALSMREGDKCPDYQNSLARSQEEAKPQAKQENEKETESVFKERYSSGKMPTKQELKQFWLTTSRQ